MIESNIPNISVEEIMEKIKAEVEKRKSSATIRNTNTVVVEAGSKPPIKLKFFKSWKATPHFTNKDIYTYKELLAYHDIDFVENAYKAILKRPVDSEG